MIVRPSAGTNTSAVSARLPENTAAGTRLATFVLRDDNPIARGAEDGDNVFVAIDGSDAGFMLEPLGESSRERDDAASGDWLTAYAVSLSVSPDYEADANLTATQRWTDGGTYRVLPTAAGAMIVPLPDSVNVRRSVDLDLVAMIRNIPEAIAVNVTGDAAAAVLLQSEVLLREDHGLGLVEDLYVHLHDPENNLSLARPRASLETQPASLGAALDLAFTSAVNSPQATGSFTIG